MNKIAFALALFLLVLGLAAANILVMLPAGQDASDSGKDAGLQGSTAQVGVFVLPKQGAENGGIEGNGG